MNTQKLQRIILDALEDVKAQDIKVYDTRSESELFDRVILASGTSNRQTRALAKSVMDKVREHGGTVIGCEGEESGDWILVDCSDVVVHIMQPAVRAYYNLEEVWGRQPVRVKLNPESLRVPNQAT